MRSKNRPVVLKVRAKWVPIASIRDAQSILLFGPGEAKGELKKRLERIGLGERIVGVETVDKMTDRQIAAKVRRHFKDNVSDKPP